MAHRIRVSGGCMKGNVLLDMEYREYKIVAFASEVSTVQIDNPRWGERTYSIHVPRLQASAMEDSDTLQTYVLIMTSAVMLLINEREKTYDP